jgi:hypothetical protein
MCIFINILQKISSQNPFYEKVKMTTKRIVVFESFFTIGSFDYDHTPQHFKCGNLKSKNDNLMEARDKSIDFS